MYFYNLLKQLKLIGLGGAVLFFMTASIQDTAAQCTANFQYSVNNCQASFIDSSSGSYSSWYWYFGDGNNSTQQNPVHTYNAAGTYKVCLYLYDSTFCDSTCKQVTISNCSSGNNCALNADFYSYMDSTNFCKYYFYDNSSGGVVNWYWDFGDGNSSTQQNPTHTYSANGNYTVTLLIDSGNCSDTMTKSISVMGCDSGSYCQAYFYDYTDTTGAFNFVDYSYGSGNVTSWYWDFGDGDTSSAQNPTHNYDSAGYYQVCLTINTDDTCSDTYCNTVYVSPSCPDLYAYAYAMGQVPCTDSNLFYIPYGNWGSQQATNVTLTVTLDSQFIPTSSWPAWSSINGNQITWNLGTLNPSQYNYIYLFDSVMCDTNVANSSACIAVNIQGSGSDCDTTDNYYTFCDSLGYSYDPNDKRVQSQKQRGGYLTDEDISAQDDLHYMIRFQNTGTAPAVDVEIRDQLDSDVNIASVQPVASSHAYDHFEVTQQGEIIWKFDNIMLPDSAADPQGSRGFVTFKVAQQQGNAAGTVIDNDAEIVFDNNTPVVTNNVRNTVVVQSTENINAKTDREVLLYPNPVRGHATIMVTNDQILQNGYDLTVYSLMGKTVKHLTGQQATQIRVKTDDLTGGIYFYKLRSGQNIVGTGKFVVK